MKQDILHSVVRMGLMLERQREYESKRRIAFCTPFARPVVEDGFEPHRCITCGDVAEYKTEFEGTDIPAFMCLRCIKVAHNRVSEFLTTVP